MKRDESKNNIDSSLKKENSAILKIDPDNGSIIYANKIAEKFYGLNVKELRGKRPSELHPKNSTENDLSQPRSTIGNDIKFRELFDIDELQKLQDDFANAFNVASVITLPDGTPITEPSNFTNLCTNIIRTTKKGLSNCYKSDATLGRYHPSGPVVTPCLSCGLWDAGSSISVGGKHVASWLIGQVRDATQSEEKMREYAREIGANEDIFIEAFNKIPSMKRARLDQIAQLLFNLSNKLSEMAYQNIQQYQYILELKEARLEHDRMMIAVEQAAEVFVLTDPEANIQYVNPAFEETTGYSRDEVIGKNLRILKSGTQDDAFYRKLWDTLGEGKIWKGRFVNKRKDDSFYTEEAIISPVLDLEGKIIHYTAVKRDITEDLQKSEILAQSQKMQSIGRLAGGVAHDFNNMLNVIMGHTELALDCLSKDNPMRANLDEVLKAAQRSANLTRQLLAFARKQTIIPKSLNLNDTIESMIKMLERLIGEHIKLVWNPGKKLKQVLVDPVQIDQLLANLIVNARDAINNEAGIITIETRDVKFDEEYCRRYTDCSAGNYVMLAVSDNGCGMTKETKEKIFDPFFTTKDVGEGTGLGLATVYGIVKQNKGFINTYSELGRGTTFKIYLPVYENDQDSIEPKSAQDIQSNLGRETILIVEDEEAILDMTTTILSHLGYTVFKALTPSKAIKLAAEHAEELDLLLTDVIMPEMNGHLLADKVKLICPNMKIIFMSGYTANLIEQQGVLEENVNFLQKPFTNSVLSETIRTVLDT